MRIVELVIHNIKKISAMEITPKGKPVVLTGDNEEGKSSVLDALLLALKNKGLVDPIKRGASKAKVNLTLAGHENGEIYIERVYTAKGGHRLKITDEKNRQIPKAQAFIDSLIGELAFDPLELTRMKASERLETLRDVLGLDFSNLDQRRGSIFAERTLVNRDLKNANERLKGMDRPAADLPAKEINTLELVGKRDAMQTERRKLDELQTTLRGLEDRSVRIENELVELQRRKEANENEIKEITAQAKKATESAATEEEIQKVSEQIENADKINQAIRHAGNYKTLKEEARKHQKTADKYTEEIEEIDAKKRELVAKAKFPVPGMEFEEDDVIVKGIPFSQLSHGEQLRISSIVAMSQHPELGILLIRDGALMNDENRGIIFDLAEERGYDVFEERFQPEPGDEGLHIIDGAVAFIDGKEVQPKEEEESEDAKA